MFILTSLLVEVGANKLDCLLKTMKRISKDRSAKSSVRKNKQTKQETVSTEEEQKSGNKQRRTPVKIRRANIKTEDENEIIQNEVTESDRKPDLTNFKFKREEKPQLSTVSPKKRSHIKVEYDEISPSKVKKEETEYDVNTEKTEDGKPFNWEVVLHNLREMRKKGDAPVDSMGCQKCPDQNETPEVKTD